MIDKGYKRNRFAKAGWDERKTDGKKMQDNITSMPEFEFVKEKLGREELLTQLAEECAELGKAALKLRRAINGKNPTPISEDDALCNLVEEMADVHGCMMLIGYEPDEIEDIIQFKMKRWAGRI